jgi:hypothetical protein
MGRDEDLANIEAAIEEIRSLGDAIADAVDRSQDLIDRRLAAIRRLHGLADRRVLLADMRATVDVMASSRTPPLLVDMVLLAVLETGDAGASVAHVHSALRHRYSRTIDRDAAQAAIRTLVATGRILDRGTRYFAPTADLARLTGTNTAPTIKALIVEALENAGGGLPPPAIRDSIAGRHHRQIPMTSLYPVIRQLEHAGRVAKAGRKWTLVDRSGASERDRP